MHQNGNGAIIDDEKADPSNSKKYEIIDEVTVTANGHGDYSSKAEEAVNGLYSNNSNGHVANGHTPATLTSYDNFAALDLDHDERL